MDTSGLASGAKNDDTYTRLWHAEPIRPEEVAFASGVFLLTKAKAESLRTTPEVPPQPQPGPVPAPEPEPGGSPEPTPGVEKTILRLTGTVPPEVWNRLGTNMLPKLRSADDLRVGIKCSVRVDSRFARNMETELRQILDDLGLSDRVRVARAAS